MGADRTEDRTDRVAQTAGRAGGPTAAQTRLARQKLALKANMARRKAQGRAKATDGGVPDSEEKSGNRITDGQG